ncbi:MAG: carboxypeptidase-like regulatory domain-containing protein, partial [Eubacterium sp.]|nr:carboxypeptidase-like regulatory domain-containing protein [Eubacterium sp.]
NITITSKRAVIPDYSLLSYISTSPNVYQGFALTGYDDSTAKDYCERVNAVFKSIGCGHSRDITFVGRTNDGLMITDTYLCNDCGNEFTDYTDISTRMSGRAVSTNGRPVKNAVISAGGQSATTDENGEFVLTGLSSGVNSVSVSIAEVCLFEQNVTLHNGDNNVEVKFRYADFISDGVINAKDYAYAFNNGYYDFEPFDFGKTESGDNCITMVNNED